MKLLSFVLVILIFGCNTETAANRNTAAAANRNQPLTHILPAPQTDGNMSVEKALANRRSRRNFQDKPLTKEQLSQILWAAYGITEQNRGLRTTPSAGAIFPLEIYVAVGNVAGIEAGLYRYIPRGHKIVRTIDKDIRNELNEATIGRRMVNVAPITIIYTAIFENITRKYGGRGIQYAYMEAGHSAQNVYLQAEALGLGTCAIGAFGEDAVSAVLKTPREKTPIYLLPIGFFD